MVTQEGYEDNLFNMKTNCFLRPNMSGLWYQNAGGRPVVMEMDGVPCTGWWMTLTLARVTKL